MPLRNLDIFVASLYFLSESIGFIGTTNGEILKTVDGGEHWALANGPVYGVPVDDFTFLGNGTGYARTYNTVLKTVNSGDSWAASYSVPEEASGITSLARSSTNSLYALWRDCPDLPNAFRTIYKSDDGINWEPTNECILGERIWWSSSGNTGISVGNILHVEWQPALHLSKDNGASWSLQSLPDEPGPIRSVAIASDDVIFLFGDAGLVLKGEIK
jgi:photosystem II stability/assembly factor-like uncharacterized protein